MSPNKLRLGALALCLTVAGIALAANQIKVGQPFPDLAKFKLEGQMPDTLQGKVVLVDFWASWCGPCKASFPVMDELQKQFGPRGLVILAVNLDDKPAAMRDFLKEHPVSFTVVRDAQKQLVGATNIGSMPSSFLLGPDGTVRAVHNGFHGDKTKQEYVAEIEALLK